MKTKSLRFWICIILSTLFATAMFTQTLAEKTTVRPEKIESSLWEYMQSAKDNELIPVNILLCGVDESLVLKKFKEKTGLDWEIFQDDELFEKEFPEKNNEEILQIRQFLQSEKKQNIKSRTNQEKQRFYFRLR